MIGRHATGTYYRLHSPKWAHQPTSGAGAAKHGGRLNRPGVEALYLAGDIETAAAEFQQASPVLTPGTLVSYSVSLRQVADFSNGFAPAQWPPIWEDFFCDWRKLVLDKIEPPSWSSPTWCLPPGSKACCSRLRRMPAARTSLSTRRCSRQRTPSRSTTRTVICRRTRLPGRQSRRSPPLPVRPAQLALITCAAERASIESAASSPLCDDAR